MYNVNFDVFLKSSDKVSRIFTESYESGSSTSTRNDFEIRSDTSTIINSPVKFETTHVLEESIPNTSSLDKESYLTTFESLIDETNLDIKFFKPLIILISFLKNLTLNEHFLPPSIKRNNLIKLMGDLDDSILRIYSLIEHIRNLNYSSFQEKKKTLDSKNKNLVIKLKPMINNQDDLEIFYNREKWLENQKLKYPKELIAYRKKNGELILLAHSKSEKELFKKLDDLFDKGELNQEEIIYFDG